MIDGMLQGDYSQMYNNQPHSSVAGDFGRTWLGQIFGANSYTDRDDWIRNEQSANNAFVRDMLALNEQNIFNANEAQKSRDFQERMSNTAYQRAVQDMKLAGINPVLAFQQGGASVTAGSSASSGSPGSRSGFNSPRSSNGLSAIASIVAGIISSSASVTAAGISAASRSKNK